MTNKEIELLKKYSENEQIEMVNKNYNDEDVANMSESKRRDIIDMRLIYAKKEKAKERTIKNEKKKRKKGLFYFYSNDAKLLFWGVLAILGLIAFVGEKEILLESPSGLGFPLWIMFLLIIVVVWVLAKFID
jgi:hypothetical protein